MSLIQETSLNCRADARGALVAIEGGTDVPFDIKRIYYIFGTKEDAQRGAHAHFLLRQMAICVAGSCRFTMDDGNRRQTHVLDRNTRGLLIDPMIWHEMDCFSPDCILLVLADGHYDKTDYIHDYEHFLDLAQVRIRPVHQLVA